MENINLETILSRVPTSTATKTASEDKETKDKDEVAEAKKGVESAVAEAKEEANEGSKDGSKEECDCPSEKEAAEKVAAVEKIASELLDADTDSMMKLAELMGMRFETGRLAQSAVHAEAAQALQTDAAMPKTAEEAQEMGYVDSVNSLGSVIDSADAGYASVCSNIEKLAADIEERGYRQADFLIKKAQESAKA